MPDAVVPARTEYSWTLWCAAAAVVCTNLGTHWDIAWHESIGRDTFWSPPHLAIYAGALMSGLACGTLILLTTFGRNANAQAASVSIFGLRAPMGAFIGAWGGVTMLTSAPFDDWWHNAYGLDVKILSPPHMVLALGILGLQFGTLLLMCSALNRAEGGLQSRRQRLFLTVSAFSVAGLMVVLLEETARGSMHGARFYRILAMVSPWHLMMLGTASRHKWGSTIAAGGFTVLRILMLWIFPLIPAEPKLGPVLTQVHSLIPAEFPILIIVPALALDWLRARPWGPTRIALVAGPAYVALLLAVQWPFADFLHSPLSRNWVFGTHLFGYQMEPWGRYAQFQYWSTESSSAQFIREMGLAVVIAQFGSWLGLRLGGWLRGVVR